MTEIDISRRVALAGMLSDCASTTETAVVGIISIVLPDDDLDTRTQAIRRALLDHAHELREIAAALQADKR